MKLIKENAYLFFALIPFLILAYAHVGLLLTIYPLYIISNFILILSLKAWYNTGYIAFYHKSKHAVFITTSIIFLVGYIYAIINL